MAFKLHFTSEASQVLELLADDAGAAVKLRKVNKALGLLQRNPRHPGLQSHEYVSITGPTGGKLWESYVENRTPRAWRIWWSYGPERDYITIDSIGPHPD